MNLKMTQKVTSDVGVGILRNVLEDGEYFIDDIVSLKVGNDVL